MTASPEIHADFTSTAPVSAASVWWRGKPLNVEARHFLLATAQASGRSEVELTSRRRGAELVRWRRLGMAAAARCQHLSGPAVAQAFGHDASLVVLARAQMTALGASDPEIGKRIAEIQWRAMALAISEMTGGKP